MAYGKERRESEDTNMKNCKWLLALFLVWHVEQIDGIVHAYKLNEPMSLSLKYDKTPIQVLETRLNLLGPRIVDFKVTQFGAQYTLIWAEEYKR